MTGFYAALALRHLRRLCLHGTGKAQVAHFSAHSLLMSAFLLCVIILKIRAPEDLFKVRPVLSNSHDSIVLSFSKPCDSA